MRSVAQALEDYVKGVEFPDTSPFEVLELLDTRSRLAEHEAELTPKDRERLEVADDVFLQNAPSFLDSLSELGSLAELRARAGAPCSHWWWYLDKLNHHQRLAA